MTQALLARKKMLRYIHESSYDLDEVGKANKVKNSAFSLCLFTSLVASKQNALFLSRCLLSLARLRHCKQHGEWPVTLLARACTTSPVSSRKC